MSVFIAVCRCIFIILFELDSSLITLPAWRSAKQTVENFADVLIVNKTHLNQPHFYFYYTGVAVLSLYPVAEKNHKVNTDQK